MSALSSAALLLMALLPGPNAAPGWARGGEARCYSPDSLYEHIDGAADLYVSYGFKQAVVGDYVKGGEGERWITVDIYDMGAPLHAFGIYGAEKPPDVEETEVGEYGMQGYSLEGLVALWKGRYYVKVSAVEREDVEAAEALAMVTAGKLPARLKMPEELRRLPSANGVAGSERYVKTSALGHKFLGEVVSAEYKLEEATATLYVADLGPPESAAAGWQKLRDFESRTGEKVEDVSGVGEDAFAATDGYYGEMVAARQGQFLVLGMSEEAGRAELTALARKALSVLAPSCEGGVCRAP